MKTKIFLTLRAMLPSLLLVTSLSAGADSFQCIDLGLPSGTLWATCNVGAARPSDAGLFFAWGETTGHEADPSDGYLFNWENYLWAEVIGEDTYFTKYCTDSSRGLDGFSDGKTELDPEDDAAYVNWGSQWRMPSKEQQDELKSECTWTWTTMDDVNGYEVTGPNGNSIFLPETGWRIDDMLLEGGAFWSRSTDPESDGGAFYIGFDSWGEYIYGGRLDGQCVRPVVNTEQTEVYAIDLPSEFEHGMVYCDKQNAAEGETVTLTVVADEGYELETLTVTTIDDAAPGSAVALLPRRANVDFTPAGEGIYTFEMPAAPVTVIASFKVAAATGVANICVGKAGSGIRYNVMGQRVDGSYRGIVIEDGRKFVSEGNQ